VTIVFDDGSSPDIAVEQQRRLHAGIKKVCSALYVVSPPKSLSPSARVNCEEVFQRRRRMGFAK
jgi:hypothetical protein